MHSLKKIIVSLALVPIWISACNSLHEPSGLKPCAVIPTQAQADYQAMEFIGFIHFTVNTFTDREWGYGDEDPAIFNPSQLDVEQWATVAKEAGMKELVLTTKHHDGFCLWPSKFTEHSIKNSPYNDGQGDIVREFVDACRENGLKAGLYLSPWDRNHKDYGRPEYIEYYRNQLRELLTEYGEINEIWFDGANGGDGYYGGAREKRVIDAKAYYGWDSIFALVKSLQPNIKIFSDAGPDVHWIGNEQGFAGETFWSTINTDSIVIGHSDMAYLNSGDPGGRDWVVGQCDVSIRPGWFYHENQDSMVKTSRELVDIYYKSIGRNAILLLNLPPDQRGLIHENDIDTLRRFREILDDTFAVNLLKNCQITTNSQRGMLPEYAPENAIDNDCNTFWAADDSVQAAALTLKFMGPVTFDRIMIQEPIHMGQRVSGFRVMAKAKDGWKNLYEGTTIGYKRLIRIEPVETSELKLIILDSKNTVAISNLGIYQASSRENK